MSDLFTLHGATKRDPAVAAWLRAQDDELGARDRRNVLKPVVRRMCVD